MIPPISHPLKSLVFLGERVDDFYPAQIVPVTRIIKPICLRPMQRYFARPELVHDELDDPVTITRYSSKLLILAPHDELHTFLLTSKREKIHTTFPSLVKLPGTDEIPTLIDDGNRLGPPQHIPVEQIIIRRLSVKEESVIVPHDKI